MGNNNTRRQRTWVLLPVGFFCLLSASVWQVCEWRLEGIGKEFSFSSISCCSFNLLNTNWDIQFEKVERNFFPRFICFREWEKQKRNEREREMKEREKERKQKGKKDLKVDVWDWLWKNANWIQLTCNFLLFFTLSLLFWFSFFRFYISIFQTVLFSATYFSLLLPSFSMISLSSCFSVSLSFHRFF